MTNKYKFLSEQDASEITKLIDEYLDCKYVLTGQEITGHKSYDELKKSFKKTITTTKDTRYMCPKCNKNRGRFRKSTNDYRCEDCKEVFKQ
ncbi:MAG: hypothetical protein Q7R52_01820 [archaeon]|nr:hypothetical protein [archaeon]